MKGKVMTTNNKSTKRESVALLGLGANAPELFECGGGVYELDTHGKTYRFKAESTEGALDKVYSGEYKN